MLQKNRRQGRGLERKWEVGRRGRENVCTRMGVNVWLGTHLTADQRLKGNGPHRKLGEEPSRQRELHVQRPWGRDIPGEFR